MKSTEGDVCYFEVNAVINGDSGASGAAGGEYVNCKVEETG